MIKLCNYSGASKILSTDKWAGLQVVDSSGAYHSRFMRPTYELHDFTRADEYRSDSFVLKKPSATIFVRIFAPLGSVSQSRN